MQWLLAPSGGFFHDTDIPRFASRAEQAVVKAGDVVRFTLAAERHEVVVDGVDGHLLILKINMLGREVRTRVPVSMVEVAA
jgi:plastocyanin